MKPGQTALQEVGGGREGSGAGRAQSHGCWAGPRIEIWVSRLRKVTFGELVDE